jgi:hypothetical protein
VVIVCAIRGAYHWFMYWRSRNQRTTPSPEPELTGLASQPAEAISPPPEPVRAERD